MPFEPGWDTEMDLGGKCHPGAVWLADGIRNAFGLAGKKLRSTEYTVTRINAIVDSQVGCCVLSQHHDAAHAGWGDRLRAPM